MKTIEVDDELYHYIASRTQAIGESASDILRRLLRLPSSPQPFVLVQPNIAEELNASTKSTNQAKKQTNIEKTVQKFERVLKSDTFVNETKNVRRFLMLLSALHISDQQGFANATAVVTGTERTYFATNEDMLLRCGNGVKAKKIPDSPFWVVTNNSTARKGLILTAVMQSMQMPSHLIDRVRVLFA
ncbi:Negative modulator of initiation of replication [[Haemophilus] ducreyi]|uniref:Negative modulator of initiation of replication n=2 Tax=Haemophilus ducreyi TaxID=730 RepID=SEQA_HAEDU|nr:replication initiation negative regulator SeqA [[Haemophilus] ducreyi]Q7VLX4.1 RecName: Full=Negative modulator of initiation of replication [[Haemophilus] ducreyi 35000HP]AAP96096.1 DNA replication inhibitor protein [[Haemophilus] ducreyi 35000HP]AKO31077.1 Negative modulator of initiation of replication [[Haemophilus] ducreyi]AKO32521.1 Negative modulator of initiation of replication [[Haemophilus] ducreyi]AKO33972.1 Negative modulator of initiation of replication [[Haemophilus] ducreyi]